VTSVGPLGNTSITAKTGAFSATTSVQVATFGRPTGNTITTTNLSGAWGIGVSPNGTIIAPSSDGQHTYRVDAIAGTVAAVSGVTGGLDVAFSLDGVRAYVGNTNSNRVDIIDVASNSVTGSFPTVQPLAVQVSRDNSTLYVGSSGLVVAYDLATKAEKARMNVAGAVNAITPHPSLDLIYATAFDGAIVAEINTSSNTVTRTFHVVGTAQENAVSTDGTTLYVAIEGNDLALFDLTSGTQLPSVTGGGGFGAALTPDGQELWVVGGNLLKIINTTSHTIRTVTLPLGGRRIVFSGDGSTAVITGEGSGLMFVR
jgi:YVTN family beta-propeller protein